MINIDCFACILVGVRMTSWLYRSCYRRSIDPRERPLPLKRARAPDPRRKAPPFVRERTNHRYQVELPNRNASEHAIELPGGASSSHTVGSRTTAHHRPTGFAAGKSPGCPGTVTPGIAAEWPRAGWGPGALTVTRPPHAAGASETARSTAAVRAAFAGFTGAVLEVGGNGTQARVGESMGDWNGSVGGGCDTVSIAGTDGYGGSNSSSAAAMSHSLHRSHSHSSMRPVMSSSVPPSEEPWGDSGGGGHQRIGEEREAIGEGLVMGKAGDDSDSRRSLGGENDAGAAKEEEEGAVKIHPSDGIVSMQCSNVDGKDGSKPVEASSGQHSTGGGGSGGGGEGGESGESGGAAEVGGTTGKESPRQEQHHQQQQGMRLGHRGVQHGDGDRDGEGSGARSQESAALFDEELSVSGGMLLYNLDCGTLEPPSPEPPSPEQRGDVGDAVGPEQEPLQRGNPKRRKRREKRTMTSVYVR